MQVNMYEAKTKLTSLVKLLDKEEEIIIARNGTPVAKLVPYTQTKERPFGTIEITSEHAAATADLSYPKNLPQHKDPFDRILIAQAKCEGMILLTADSKILKYDEPCIMR